MNRHVVLLMFLASFGTLHAAPSGTEHPFYLTGVFSGSDGELVALITLADGDYQRLRLGGSFDHGTVTDIGPQWIDVLEPGSDEAVRVYLRGIAAPAPTASSESSQRADRSGDDSGATQEASAAVPGTPEAPLNTGSRGVAEQVPEPAERPGLPNGQSLPELAQALRQEAALSPPDRATSDLGAVLGPMIGFPSDAEVVELQSGPPRSFRQGLDYVTFSAEQGRSIHLTVERGGDRQRIVVMPRPEGAVVNMSEEFPTR